MIMTMMLTMLFSDNSSHNNSSHDNSSHDNSSHDNSSHDANGAVWWQFFSGLLLMMMMVTIIMVIMTMMLTVLFCDNSCQDNMNDLVTIWWKFGQFGDNSSQDCWEREGRRATKDAGWKTIIFSRYWWWY